MDLTAPIFTKPPIAATRCGTVSVVSIGLQVGQNMRKMGATSLADVGRVWLLLHRWSRKLTLILLTWRLW